MAARLGVPQLSDGDRVTMEAAILKAVDCGERGFTQLQQAAFDAVARQPWSLWIGDSNFG